MKSPLNTNKSAPLFQKISIDFFDLGQKSQFEGFDPYKNIESKFSNRDFWPKSKKSIEIF